MRASLLTLVFFFVTSTFSLGQSLLVFPRVSFEPDELLGIAIVNPTDEDATVSLRAIDSMGRRIEADGFSNPVEVVVAAGQQFSGVASAIFGVGPAGTVGWIRGTSSVPGLTGFFLLLDRDVSFFDGADLPVAAEEIVFPEVRLGEGETTELNIVSPMSRVAQVTLELNRAGVVQNRELQIARLGAARIDLGEFFGIEDTAARPRPLGDGDSGEGSFVRVISDNPVAGFEVVRGTGDILGVNAQPLPALANTLFFPQLAVLPPFVTELSLVSSADETALVTITAQRPDGSLYGQPDVGTNPVTRSVAAGGSLRADLEELFGFVGDTTLEGWIRVDSTARQIQGTISYSIPSIHSIASVPGVAEPTRQAVFSHIATTLGFFTGIAALNTAALAANVRIVAIQPDGTVLGSFSTTLLPGQRISRLLSDIIPAASGRGGGLIWVQSDVPIFLTSLFGSLSSGVLANIPPQPVPTTFIPTSEEPLLIEPPLAVLTPAAQQQFSVPGVSQGLTWSVNGMDGGNDQVGTISSTGRFSAPALVPMALPVTIGARSEGRATGATVDVLTRETLVSGLGFVTSVAYLEGLNRLFVAEADGFFDSANTSTPAGLTGSSILDVTNSDRLIVATFPDEAVGKILPFVGVDNGDYLLLSGNRSGRIIRLDPSTGDSVDVATDLTAPSAMALDPTGALLVADQGVLRTVPAAALNVGLGPASPAEVQSPDLGVVAGLPSGISGGIASDNCTGDIYLSDFEGGEILRLSREDGTLSTLVSGLNAPSRLLGFQRSGVGCPLSFHLLVLESNLEITLIVPSTGLVRPWMPVVFALDLAFTHDTELTGAPVVLLAEVPKGPGRVIAVNVPALYSEEALNEPAIRACLGVFCQLDPDLEAAARSALGLEESEPITPEAALTLRTLDASFRGIRSLEGIEVFANLEVLSLEDNEELSDMSPLNRLANLVELDVAESGFSDTSQLAGLTGLRILRISDNGLTDFDGLESLTNLVQLDGRRNDITDPAPLQGLTSLVMLDLSRNQISNASSLAGLTTLVELDLDFNMISDVSPFAGLSAINELSLRSNNIASLTPLLANAGLGVGDGLDVRSNPLDVGDCPDIGTLRGRGVSVNSQVVCPP